MAELTKKDIIGMVGVIKANYYYHYKDMSEADINTLVNTWLFTLGGQDKELVMNAFYRALKHCKFAPTIADITEEIEKVRDAFDKSDTELWHELHNALQRAQTLMSHYQYTVIGEDGRTQGERARDEVRGLYASLDDRIKVYCGGFGEFHNLAYGMAEAEFEKGRFLKAIKEIKERERTKAETPLAIQQIVNKEQQLLIENNKRGN